MNIHEGHRMRKKRQFVENGLDAFAEHEVLELLLYYAIPRRDTNPIAHALLNRFGTLDGVFSAPREELLRVDGLGENGATLIGLLLPLYQRVRLSAARRDVILDSTERACAYFVERFATEHTEVMYQVCLDAKGKLVSMEKLATGNVNSVCADLRAIVENALLCRASAVLLAHNHPSGVALPSDNDRAITLWVRDALKTMDIQLLDHIIVADGDFVSMNQSGYLL